MEEEVVLKDMTEIEIPFNDWSLDKLKHGKICTSRTKRYGREGDTFKVDFGDYYTIYRITHIVRLPLWLVRDYLYKAEGATSSSDFVRVWKKIHPKRGFVPDDIVYTHFFEEVEIVKKECRKEQRNLLEEK
jgi:hypothetical protein